MSSTDKIRKVHSHYSKKILHTAMIMDVFFFVFFFLHTEMGRGDLRDIIDLDKWLYSVFWWCLMLFRDRWLFPILRPPWGFSVGQVCLQNRELGVWRSMSVIIHNHFSKFLTMYSNLLLIKTANVWVEKGKACHIPLLI